MHSESEDRFMETIKATVQTEDEKYFIKIEADRLEKELRDLAKTGRKLGKIGEEVEETGSLSWTRTYNLTVNSHYKKVR